jgi:hypothetical protein
LQKEFVCNWWFMVDCTQARNLYYLNEEIKAEQRAADKKINKNKTGSRKQKTCF